MIAEQHLRVMEAQKIGYNFGYEQAVADRKDLLDNKKIFFIGNMGVGKSSFIKDIESKYKGKKLIKVFNEMSEPLRADLMYLDRKSVV